MAKNVRPGSSLPCDLAWEEVDVVLHVFPGEQFRELFLKRTGAPPNLSTILVSTLNIWEGHIHAQLQDAYRREGLAAPERTDMQARPNACDRRDVHFRKQFHPLFTANLEKLFINATGSLRLLFALAVDAEARN